MKNKGRRINEAMAVRVVSVVSLSLLLWIPFGLLPPLCWGQEEEGEGGIVEALMPRDSLDREGIRQDLDIISIGLEIIPSPGGGSFFNEYHLLFGQKDFLNVVISPTVVGRIQLNDQFRFVLGSSIITSGFQDIYDAYSFPPGRPGSDTIISVAQVFEELSLTAFPVLGGIQFSPIRSQFTSYVGATVGGAIVQSKWLTKTRLFEDNLFFRPATNVDGTRFIPALRLFTGIDLRFDRFYSNGNLFRGVYVEAAYFYLPVVQEYFREIRTIGRNLPFLPSEDEAILNLGGFTISFGATLQLIRQ